MKTQELEQRVQAVPEQAKGLEIVDAETCQRGMEILLTIKDLRKQIADTFGPIIQKAHAAHKEAVAQRKRHEAPLAEAETAIKDRLAVYDEAQEKKRIAEQQRLQDEAALAEAAEAEADGDTDRAQEILENGGTAAVVVAKETPRVDGVSFRETWSAEVTDFPALCKHVVETGQYELLQAEMVAIGGLARALKGALSIPGVRAVKRRVVSAGRR